MFALMSATKQLIMSMSEYSNILLAVWYAHDAAAWNNTQLSNQIDLTRHAIRLW